MSSNVGEVGVGATDDPLSVHPPAAAVPDNIGIEQFGDCPVVARRCERNEPTRQRLVLERFDQGSHSAQNDETPAVARASGVAGARFVPPSDARIVQRYRLAA